MYSFLTKAIHIYRPVSVNFFYTIIQLNHFIYITFGVVDIRVKYIYYVIIYDWITYQCI